MLACALCRSNVVFVQVAAAGDVVPALRFPKQPFIAIGTAGAIVRLPVTDFVTPSDCTSRPSGSPLSVAKDLVKRPGLEVDLGACVIQEYEGLFRGRLDPRLGVGLSVSF